MWACRRRPTLVQNQRDCADSPSDDPRFDFLIFFWRNFSSILALLEVQRLCDVEYKLVPSLRSLFLVPFSMFLAAWLGPLAMLIKRFSMQVNFKGESVHRDECVWGETGRWSELIKWRRGSRGNSQVCWRLYKWVLAVTLILSDFPLSLCVFWFLFIALFRHLSHVLYKSYLIFSGKGMTFFISPYFHFPFLPLCRAFPGFLVIVEVRCVTPTGDGLCSV